MQETQETQVRSLSQAAAAAKSLQSCPTLCDPIDGSPPGSPVPGILQAEHWSGLPFPSPMHESEKWEWSRSVVSDSSRLHGLQPTRLLRPWDFPGKRTGVGCHCLLRSESGRCSKGRHGNPHQYSCMDRGAGGLQSIGLQRVGHNWSSLAKT